MRGPRTGALHPALNCGVAVAMAAMLLVVRAILMQVGKPSHATAILSLSSKLYAWKLLYSGPGLCQTRMRPSPPQSQWGPSPSPFRSVRTTERPRTCRFKRGISEARMQAETKKEQETLLVFVFLKLQHFTGSLKTQKPCKESRCSEGCVCRRDLKTENGVASQPTGSSFHTPPEDWWLERTSSGRQKAHARLGSFLQLRGRR